MEATPRDLKVVGVDRGGLGFQRAPGPAPLLAPQQVAVEERLTEALGLPRIEVPMVGPDRPAPPHKRVVEGLVVEGALKAPTVGTLPRCLDFGGLGQVTAGQGVAEEAGHHSIHLNSTCANDRKTGLAATA